MINSTRSVLLCLALCAAGFNTIDAQAPDAGILRPGDVLRVTVWRNAELTGEFPIGPDGRISHPLYQEINVTGLGITELNAAVRRFIERFEATPAFSLAPMIRVFVGGQVREPGIQMVPLGTTLTEAVAAAGGPTDQALLERTRLRRLASVTTIDLQGASAERNLPLVSGDEVMVPRRRNVWLEVVAPVSSVVGAAAALVTIIIR